MTGFVTDLQQQRARAAGRVIDRGVVAGLRVADAEDLGDDATDFGGGVELPLALAALRGEVPHEIFVGVAEQIVAIGTVPGKIEGWVFKDGDEVGQAFHHLLTAAELVRVIKVRHIGEVISQGERTEYLLVDIVADA